MAAVRSAIHLSPLCRFPEPSVLHHTIRNQFVHFAPMGWSIEVSGIPAAAALVARLVGDIVVIGWAFRHQDRSWREALADDLAALSRPDWPS